MMADQPINTSRYRSLDRILKRSLSARNMNPRNRSVLAAGDKPTVSTSTSAPSSATYQSLPASPGSAANWTPYVAALGGWTRISSNRLYVATLTKTLAAETGGSTSTAYQGCARTIFYIDGDTVVVPLYNSTKTWRLIVDGQYEDLAGHTNASATTQEYWTISFASCTAPRKVRKIEIEFPGDFPAYFMGAIWIKKTDTLWAPSMEEIGPRVIFCSDSYGLAVGATVGGDGYIRVMADFLGINDAWCQGRGGGGYIRGINDDAGPNIREAITDITSWSPELVVIALGYNDLANEGVTVRNGLITLANTAAAAASAVSEIRAALPSVPIIVLGPWRANTNTTRNLQASYDAAILAAIDALGDTKVKTISTQSLLSGYGYVGATAGDGNSDYYLSADRVHPSTDGHKYIGQWAASKVIDAIRQLV